ncbi:MAG TPA: hypothetical protein VIB38_03475 [Aestuariivirgaceae bacterium]|jgi:hypothetical protein
MLNNPPPPEGPSPFDRLRALASRQIDELTELRERLPPEMSIAEYERFAKVFAAAIKSAQELFAGEEQARKSAEELKKEDDAVRAEFARRLAAMLRGREIVRAAGPDGGGAPSEVSS